MLWDTTKVCRQSPGSASWDPGADIPAQGYLNEFKALALSRGCASGCSELTCSLPCFCRQRKVVGFSWGTKKLLTQAVIWFLFPSLSCSASVEIIRLIKPTYTNALEKTPTAASAKEGTLLWPCTGDRQLCTWFEPRDKDEPGQQQWDTSAQLL